MSRDITGGLEAATLAGIVRPIILVELDFPSGFLRLWSGIGDLRWNGETWQGVGTLGSVSPVEETNDTRATGVAFSLSGIPSGYVSVAYREHYQGRPATMWLAVLNETGAIISSPFKLWSGRMDTMSDEDDGQTATITVQTESRLIDLERPRVRRFTDEDQRQLYPGDRGLQFVAGLQNKSIVWGPNATS